MAHARTNIRSCFVDLLRGNTIAGDHVYDNRIYNLEDGILPAIIVFTDHEEITTDTISFPRTQTRNLKVTVQCYCKTNNNASADIDILSCSVEKLILASSNLKGKCKDCRLESTDISIHSEANMPIAIASLVFNVLYQSKENTPDIRI